jgi:Flp pilus assembly protein TadG
MNEAMIENSRGLRPRLGLGAKGARRPWKRSETGSQLIEVALLMPMLIAVLLGAAEFAQLEYASIEVSNAAYAGAAYGAQSHATASNTSYIQTAALDDAANISGMTVTPTYSCSCSDGTSITCATTSLCVSPAHIEEYVQVDTSATVSPVARVPGLPTSFTLTGQAIVRVQK